MGSLLSVSLSLSCVAISHQIEEHTSHNDNTTSATRLSSAIPSTLNTTHTDSANTTEVYTTSTHGPHFHISPWILVMPSLLIFIFVVASWLAYANAFPKTTSGQILVRMKHVVSRTQTETIAYQSVDFNTSPL